MPKYVLAPAVKYMKPMKILAYGPQDAGKTLSSLYLALGFIMKKRKCTEAEAWKHMAVIDSEYRRATLYANLGPFNYFEIAAPYTCNKLIDMIKWLNTQDTIDVVIPDSLTHYWSKSGGVLDRKAAKDALGGNSFTNWQEFSGEFSTLIDTILESPKHFICTTRSKNDTVLLPNSKNKMAPVTMGLKPELRDGIEYDFDVVFNIDKESHDLIKEKGVPGMLPVYAMATPKIGMDIYDLFNTDAVVPVRSADDVMESIRRVSKENDMVVFMQLALSGQRLDGMPIDKLLKLEEDLLTELRKSQTVKTKKK